MTAARRWQWQRQRGALFAGTPALLELLLARSRPSSSSYASTVVVVIAVHDFNNNGTAAAVAAAALLPRPHGWECAAACGYDV